MQYQHIFFEAENLVARPEHIRALEATLGHNLPDDYRQFLLICNGGTIDYEVIIDFGDGTDEAIGFEFFFGLDPEQEWRFNPFELENKRESKEFPSHGLLPIAEDSGGSQLFLDVRAGYCITAYIRGLPVWTGLRQTDVFLKVADSFDHFLSLLTLTDEYIEETIGELRPETNTKVLEARLDSVRPGWREKFWQLWYDQTGVTP